ncbi:MAG TPA: hypothetical protein VFA04_21125 [Bryobacteraceae bacterium]|nr:hypothetical protein [Bryobacteraceae bacterium]
MPSVAAMTRPLLAALFSAGLALAQIGIPGQSGPPYCPPGACTQGPTGGIPLPGRHKKEKNNEDLKQVTGRIIEINADQLTVESTDHREITSALMKTTKVLDGLEQVKLDALAVGQTVMLELREDDRGNFTAVNVQITAKPPSTVVSQAPKDPARAADDNGPPKLHRGGAEQSAGAAPAAAADDTAPEPPSTVVENAPSNVAAEADDGERPVLRRGKPRETATAPKAAPVEVASAKTTPVAQPEAESPREPVQQPGSVENSEDAFLEKARDTAEEFTEGLPNFVCTEMVTRYYSEAFHGVDWKPIDVVTTKVVYEGGKESYKDTTVNGKKADPEKSGSWSYGEFGTVLVGLFHPGTAARFTFAHDSQINGFSAKMFDLEVERPRSNWTIHEGGQQIRPAYKGSVWIDKASHRVIRLEMQAVDIPKEFPLDTSEMALDYQYVSLGAKKFLVPVHAEVLACHRGTPQCDKNAIDFRNYHKFGSESDVTFGQ